MKIVQVHTIADSDGTSWQCETIEGALFAFGQTFQEARRNLADVVLDQAKATGTDIDAVRVLCLTRKTYAVSDGALQ